MTTVFRADYQAPAYLVDETSLVFELNPDRTLVTSTLKLRQNPHAAGHNTTLTLDGENLELLSLSLDGQVLAQNAYTLNAKALSIAHFPPQATLTIKTAICPAGNSELTGLYVSNGTFFTQCEAEGFRRITFFPDRPDVMSRYTVEIHAEQSRFPVLLSNGNLIGSGPSAQRRGWHFAQWADPHPKPSYLFALVAGKLVPTESHHTAPSGRTSLLQVWVAPGDEDKTAHAMACLKQAIEWDETRFNLELDLDRFMIVASHDFNMGAMENKGLNIFNARYVLANPSIATDDDYAHIESIVAHEYFHNWTGNRVTCRDWFQLSLKEGLTVFRDQEFSADRLRAASPTVLAAQWAAAVKRIEDVRTLRSVQFAEDAGPQAHAVRPDHYQEINNFYTATVYEKGAEVVRMLHTILGPEGFKRGLALYFERHDGQAVTCDDFLNAMRDANNTPLPGFELWYSQAGTPRIVVSSAYDERDHTFELTLSQHTNATADAPDKKPVCLPVTLGLVLPDGTDAALRLDSDAPPQSDQEPSTTRTVLLTQAQQRFKFMDVPACPVTSLLRGFSAPAELDYRYSDSELILLAKHDHDPFNRWEAVQRLAQNRILAGIDALLSPSVPAHDEALLEVYAHLLGSALAKPAELAPAFLNQALRLPDEALIAEHCAIVDPTAVRNARQTLLKTLGTQLKRQWQAVYETYRSQAPYQWSHTASAQRALSNLALRYWAHSGDDAALAQARKQLDHADNMTDREAALITLINSTASFKAKVLLDLARSWSHEPLLMNKWFRVQATAVAFPGEPDVLSRVKVLTTHSAYHPSNPNNVYALVLAFCAHNMAEFHREDGSGYDFWVEQVQHLDRINPTVAARLARSLDRWRKFTPIHQKHMQAALRTVAQTPELSTDVQEIIHNALKY